MADNQIEEVKSKTDIVSLLSEYLELKKAGRNYKTNCPFHGEKTPSFMISPELQMYKCFGCSKSGDVFTFLEEHEGMEFGEALKYLADKAGVKLISFKPEATSEREKIIEINKNALNFYQYVLTSHPRGKKALDYLIKDRGLNLQTIKQFKIGYSPEDYSALSNYLLNKKKYKPEELVKAGLLVGRGIDRFRGRVIFPLFDHRDNVIGFSGRLLPWVNSEMGKYINSPDTPAYHKSNVLYGLNISKSSIRDDKFAIIVEGELDMISSYKAGIKNVIAIKGSALTENQIRLIGRFTKTIILSLDSDFAGDEAAKKGAISASNLGFEVRVACLQGYKDPDEIARKDPDKYRKEINEAVPIWDFLIDSSIKKYGLVSGEDKKKISQETIPLLASIEDKIVQAHYVEVLARKLSVPAEAVISEIEKKPQAKQVDEISNLSKQDKSRRQLLEEKLLVNLVFQKSKRLFTKEIKDLISTRLILKIIDYLQKKEKLPAELSAGYNEIVLANPEEENLSAIIKELGILSIKDKLEQLAEKIKTDENNKSLLEEFNQLTKQLSAL